MTRVKNNKKQQKHKANLTGAHNSTKCVARATKSLGQHDRAAEATQSEWFLRCQLTLVAVRSTGTLPSNTNTHYTVEFFVSEAPDASGNGEGDRFLGATSVTTDAVVGTPW